jgi:hypothetical protein
VAVRLHSLGGLEAGKSKAVVPSRSTRCFGRGGAKIPSEHVTWDFHQTRKSGKRGNAAQTILIRLRSK